MAGMYWLGALLVGLVVGIVAWIGMNLAGIGYAIGVGTAVVARATVARLPGRHPA